jgi:SAM-dependent methyltransferase
MARDPKQFPRDDRRVYDAYIAGRESAAVAVGVRLGLFDALGHRPRTEEELRAHLGVRERPLRSLLAALSGMRFVERGPDDRYALADDVADYLVRGKPGWLGGLIDLEIEHFLSPAALLDAMTADRPRVYGETDPWEAHEADPEAARRFTAAMHSVSERPAAGLAEVVDFSGVKRLLDVGGGSGALSIAIARAWPSIECVIWDLDVVCGIAREYVQRAGLSSRVSAATGNMFTESYPPGFDAVLLSQILHDWPEEKGLALLRKAHAALPPGGTVLIHEKLVDDDGRGPRANALVNLDMLLWTEGQQFTLAQLQALLTAAGFPAETVKRRDTAGNWSVVTAAKK